MAKDRKILNRVPPNPIVTYKDGPELGPAYEVQ